MLRTKLAHWRLRQRLNRTVTLRWLAGDWGGRSLVARFKHWRLNRRLGQAVIASALAGAGLTKRAWPITEPIDSVTSSVQAWLTTALAHVRTPQGIDTCMLCVYLVQITGDRWHKLWSQFLPSFTRHDPQATRQLLDQMLLQLPRTEYSAATHIEIHLVSLGDIVAFQDR